MNRIFVGWDNGDFISMGISDNNDECKDFQLLVRENGPPDTVEYRAAGEGYVSGSEEDDSREAAPIPDEVLYGLGLQEFAEAFNAYSKEKAGEK